LRRLSPISSLILFHSSSSSPSSAFFLSSQLQRRRRHRQPSLAFSNLSLFLPTATAAKGGRRLSSPQTGYNGLGWKNTRRSLSPARCG
ncbi:hypothetical protein LINGRAHAP2_LOCUS3968, partial [Linum grandiflorum]